MTKLLTVAFGYICSIIAMSAAVIVVCSLVEYFDVVKLFVVKLSTVAFALLCLIVVMFLIFALVHSLIWTIANSMDD